MGPFRASADVCLREAKIEFGEAVASTLKLSPDGTKVLWPQPADDPEDPQNVRLPVTITKGSLLTSESQWSDFRKGLQLFIVTLAAIVPDFDSGLGTASIFQLARQFGTTTGRINDLTNK